MKLDKFKYFSVIFVSLMNVTTSLRIAIDKSCLEAGIKYSDDTLTYLANLYHLSLLGDTSDSKESLYRFIDEKYHKEEIIFSGSPIIHGSYNKLNCDILITNSHIEANSALEKGLEVILLNPIFEGEINPRIKVVKDWKEAAKQIASLE